MLVNKNIKELYGAYKARMHKIADIRNANAVLSWDQETYLPAMGAASRGQQIATLTAIAHEYFTDNSLGDLLRTLNERDGLQPVERKNVERSLEDYEKNKKYSTEFVTRLSMASSECYHAWVQSRKENNYSVFEPALQKMVQLKKEEADILGYHSHPYNALLNDFEKGADIGMLDKIFTEVKTELSALLLAIRQQPQAESGFLHQHFPKDKQWEWGITLLKENHFDFNAGRQDISEHPFTTSFNPRDVRVTTRIDENDFGNMIWSCIHEGGHALYEQGLNPEEYGLPCGEAASLAIHESQSRLWENNVGRSLAYWKYNYPKLQQLFPRQLAATGLPAFYRAINKVQPSLIRTEADELTYHFHIMIRYEIEKGLIDGSIATKELKEVWKHYYHTYLQVEASDDKQGVLQDIHWSHGSFGYFPTYSLGSFYAAQFFAKATKEIEGMETEIENGNTGILLAWLRKNIHQYGRQYTAEELCRNLTGEGLNFHYFLNYARKKYQEVYQPG